LIILTQRLQDNNALRADTGEKREENGVEHFVLDQGHCPQYFARNPLRVICSDENTQDPSIKTISHE
jgi:hypothetical protein